MCVRVCVFPLALSFPSPFPLSHFRFPFPLPLIRNSSILSMVCPCSYANIPQSSKYSSDPAQGWSIQVQHVFACESHESKRQLLLQEHPDVLHCFADVSVFETGSGYCDRCHCQHEVNQSVFGIDILIAGPSCKSVSRLNSQRADHAQCYIDSTGTSGSTYEFGFRKAPWQREGKTFAVIPPE